VQAVVFGSWMCWQQSVEGNQDEEEEILTQYESKQNVPVQGQTFLIFSSLETHV